MGCALWVGCGASVAEHPLRRWIAVLLGLAASPSLIQPVSILTLAGSRPWDLDLTSQVRPYIMDLGSTNGSFVNGERVEAQRYIELLAKDVLRFGYR